MSFDLSSACKETLRARLVRKRAVDPSGCWIWQGARWGKYGSTQYRYKRLAVHRAAYVIWREPIPEPLVIDHLCRNTRCFNPDHLECVTVSVNTARGNSYRARVTHCPKGHPYDSANTYLTPQGWRDCRTCRTEACRKYYRRSISV